MYKSSSPFWKIVCGTNVGAYYDCTCKSNDLFKNFEISASDDYNEHLNQYNVIYLDLAGIISKMDTNGIPLNNVASRIKALLNQEIRLSYPTLPQYDDASDAILAIVNERKQKFVFIIDEWDAVIREAKNDTETQKSYLNLLREWFKNVNFADEVVATAYMTGILPIKKDDSESDSESAVSDFKEFTILQPGPFVQYTGFTESEVKQLCE